MAKRQAPAAETGIINEEFEAGILHAEQARPEDSQEGSLRPRFLKEFLGQEQIKSNLSVYISATKARGEPLDHLFLIGPPGLGKTTLAQVTANEMGGEFTHTVATALEKPKDLAGILTKLTEGAVFFIDEIHSLKPAIEEMLYIAMEDYEMDWMIGQGPAARTIRIPIKPFTLVGATTKAGNVAGPLISRFGITFRFSFYEQADMEAIIRRSAEILDIGIDADAVPMLASSARGTPRVANRLLRRMRDFGYFLASGQKVSPENLASGQILHATGAKITAGVVREGLKRLEIDSLGLERYDREILKMIIERYGGGPVGAETLAISIGESVDTLEDYYEPFLIQAGLLQRSPRGRMATAMAYKHLGLKQRGAGSDGPTLF